MSWDVDGKADTQGEVKGTRLSFGQDSEKREVSAVDWGKDIVSNDKGSLSFLCIWVFSSREPALMSDRRMCRRLDDTNMEE